MQIEKNRVVYLHFILKDMEGEVVDYTEDDEPMAFVMGSGEILPAIEKALEGKAKGDQVELTLEPSEAYGERDEGLIQELDLNTLEGVEELEIGMVFQAENEEGVAEYTVIDLDDEVATLDGNHPFAGETLDFSFRVILVREATEAELQEGIVLDS